MAYTGLYNASGKAIVQAVPGTVYTGLYSPDGCYNGVLTTESTTIKGRYHPCGALWITEGASTTASAPDGSTYVTASGGAYILNYP